MMEGGEAHVLVFPFPAQGHVPPMLKLAELVSHAGLRVTFVNTDNIHRRFLASSPALPRLAGLPRFRFRTIPDGLPEDHPRPFLQFLDLEESLRTRSREPYRELLVPSDPDPDGWPPVTCVMADAMLRLASEVAAEMEIPLIFFRTSGACAVWAYLCTPDLIKGGDIPFPEEEEGLDATIRGVPGMEGFLRRRDLPSFCRNAKTTSDRGLQFVANANANVRRGRGLILNTFESLEGPVLSHIRSAIPNIYALGPLHLLSRTFGGCGADVPFSSNSASLWQEDRSCLKWLDSQPRRSVVYISFGSVTMMSRDKLMEFWQGLVDSGKRFLWVVRPDLVEGKMEEAILEELEKETRERGCFVGWAPQEEVLAHPAVGCFLTHSGWNSTLESAAAGVPMICWPFFADQQVNSRFVGEVWRIGLDMKDKRGRSVVERMVREAMEGERAEKLRTSAGKMAELARSSVGEGGSSYRDFENLVKHIKAMSSEK